MKKLLIFIILCTICSTVSATGQISELIVIGTDTLCMETIPLDRLPPALSGEFRKRVEKANNGSLCTALWRGYQGLWELKRDTLRLLSVCNIDAVLDKTPGGQISMTGICVPGGYADWFSGDIRVVSGNILGQAPINCFEHETIYTLRRGVVVGKRTYCNRMIGSRAAFEKAMKGQNNTLRILDPDPYLSIFAFFSYTPSAEGRFRGFDHIKLVLRTPDGEQTIENAADHYYLRELVSCLHEIEPYGICYRGEMQPVSWGLLLWRRILQKE